MTRYMDKDRRDWRARLRTLRRRFNALLAALVLLAVLAPKPTTAAPRCPGGDATPRGCSYQIDRDTRCAWPMRWVKVGNVTLCIRLEVQP